MFLNWNHSSIRLFGRWDRTNPDFASTVNPGSQIEIAFTGRLITLLFNLSTNIDPYPHLWIELDGEGRIEVPLAQRLKVQAKEEGRHLLRIIFKSANEFQNRWAGSLQAVVRFEGADAEGKASLPADPRKIIEFIGDSITEGILIDVENFPEAGIAENRVLVDDCCATYAWLAAEKLDMKPRIIGFGGVGVTKSGSGGVVPAQCSYSFVFEGSPAKEESADVIVINHGTNDQNASLDDYRKGYLDLLKTIRAFNPNSQIFCLSPFFGGFETSLPPIIHEHNRNSKDSVRFISTAGWLPPEPVHPLREGHKHVCELLLTKLSDF